MAPMLVTIESELQAAPHTIKAPIEATVSRSELTEPVISLQCQVCFEDCATEGETATAVTLFCSNKCPAVLCRGCLAQHVRVSVSDAFAGVLPKVRCPICLVPVNKAKWVQIADKDVVDMYTNACRLTCSFRTPCCHDAAYSHLPYKFDETKLPSKYIQPAVLQLTPSIKKQLDPLRRETRRFCNHKITAKALTNYVEDTFGRRIPLETQHLLVEHILPRILDEERRATLLLAYHAKYKAVTTRCCGARTCFNCKRHMDTHPSDDKCDVDEISADCIVECRSCHVTMVKVEGCSAVQCWCGFDMDWVEEVRLRDMNKRQLLPVDLFDTELVGKWVSWQLTLIRYLKDELFPMRRALRISLIDQQLATNSRLRTILRVTIQTKVWKHRFRKAFPQFTEELSVMRMKLLAKRLQQYKSFVEAMRRLYWRQHWRRVVSAVRMKQFWISYSSEHPVEQRELRADAMAMLLPGLC